MEADLNNKMQYVDNAMFIEEYLSKNVGVKNKLVELFGKCTPTNYFWRLTVHDVIRPISQNKKLFFAYARGDFEKHYDLDRAFSKMGDDILISFTDLKLYAIVKSVEDFKEFIGVLPGIVTEGNNCNLHQIILTAQNQKIIFVGNTDDKSVESIKTHVKNYLKADISVTDIEGGKQITIEKLVKDYMTSMQEFNDLQEYIVNYDDDIARLISLISKSRSHQYKQYIEANVTECINAKTIEELVKCLKTVTCETLNITINNGVINNVAGNMTIINKVDKKADAKEWIANNNPNEGELTSEYYNRYKTHNPNAIHHTQFGKIVTSVINKRPVQSTGGVRKWN